MRKLLFLPFLFLALTAKSQFFLAGGHMNGSLATGQLKQESGGLFIPTVSGILLYEFETAPVQLGVELGYGIYGTKLELRDDLYPGFTDELRLRRNNNIATGMAMIRFLPLLNTRITPFVEAQFGANYLYTRYKIRESFDAEEALESGKDLEDWTIAYRIGTGFQIPLDQFLKLEIRATYQDGGSVRFLQKGDVGYLPDEEIFDYTTRRSPMNYLTFSFGLIFYDL